MEALNLESPGKKQLISIGLMLQQRPLETYEFIFKLFGPDMAWMPWFNQENLFLYKPEYIRHVLKDNHANYVKAEQYEQLKPILGEGLLTSEGEVWRKQRKIMAKEFHPPSIDEYVKSIRSLTDHALQALPQKAEGVEIDIEPFFSQLTFQIAGEIFFGASVDQFSADVNKSLGTQLDIVSKRIRRSWNMPYLIPTKENLEAKKAQGHLNSVVTSILKDKSKTGKPDNVLTKLQGANPPVPPHMIRDEVMTLLLAGHETTSNALMWTVYYLGLHPEWQSKILGELQDLHLKAHEIGRAELESLPALKEVILESMRLRPPIPAIARKAVATDKIGDFVVPAGTSVICQQWITHRDSRFWNQPEEFKPERFKNREMKRDDYTYFPFAKGPRACIGEELSMVEASLILLSLIQDYEWKMKDGFKPRLVHHLTLKSANGMVVDLKRRESAV